MLTPIHSTEHRAIEVDAGESRAQAAARHRRSNPPRQSLRYAYRIGLATLKSRAALVPSPTVKAAVRSAGGGETLRPDDRGGVLPGAGHRSVSPRPPTAGDRRTHDLAAEQPAARRRSRRRSAERRPAGPR